MTPTRATLSLAEPFDLRATLASGAAFGWGRYRRGRLLAYGDPDADAWRTAPTYGCVLRLRQPSADRVDIECSVSKVDHPALPQPMAPDEFVRWYFRMEEPLAEVEKRICVDPHVAEAVRRLPGLRLIRVEPVECLLTFLASPQNRIAKIALILNAVSRHYGEPVETPWGRFSLPPAPPRLAAARASRLAACGLRYGLPQARNMIRTFRRISGYGSPLSRLRRERVGVRVADYDFFKTHHAAACPYETAWTAVQSACMGAGPKVSDCVCLFALGHLEAVPVDVHVFNSTLRLYRAHLRGLRATDADHLTAREYRRIGDFYRARFGRFAGYAQQYLFTAERLRRGFYRPA